MTTQFLFNNFLLVFKRYRNSVVIKNMTTVARRIVEGTEANIDVLSGKIATGLQISPNAVFIQRRLQYFDKLYQKQQESLNSRSHDRITITLSDGAIKEGARYQTTPLDIAKSISKGLSEAAVIAKVFSTESVLESNGHQCLVCTDEDENEQQVQCDTNAQLWDMTRPLETNCKLEFLKFDSPEGQHVFWHSSSHILGQSLEMQFGAHLTIGPALERGFYYDSYLGEDLKVTHEMYEKIEGYAERICKENQPFQRLILSKDEALEMFKENPFKVVLIKNKVPDGALTSVYRCGPLIDLCRGPHLPSTGKVKAFSVEKHSAVYWLGNAKSDNLQRVYAISFPDSKLMKQYKTMMEEAKKRDHRTVGNAMNLFFFETNLSPGSCFWLPDGAKIYNKLTEFIRREYRIRGFSEVISPNIFSCDLFKVSGHYQNYKENMYCFDVEGKEWALKPMNCPGHCLMFKHMNPSYRQLPIRMADFGVLHRNEASGSLTGLTRVRRFQQDDAHIFCRLDQVKTEVQSALEFLFFVYGIFGFTFEMKLSTRPAKALGDVNLWNQAETALAEAMDATGKPWTLNPGDGAFYGPKIDIRLRDALERWNQCGTIQLDFQLPLRFNLSYRTADEVRKAECGDLQADHSPVPPELSHTEKEIKRVDGSWEAELKPGYARPVMVHRAILGSIERMSAILVEHTGGKFPFWLSPKQALLCPISEKNLEYARHIASILQARGYEVGVDDSNATINKKIRQGQIDRWNYLLVVGQQEQESNSVTVRNRDDPKNQNQMTITELLEKFELMTMPMSKTLTEVEPFLSKT